MLNENQPISMKKRNPLVLIIVLLAIIFLASVAITALAVFGTGKSKIEKQLELGRKYLDALEYEQAIAAFKEAIKIDPKSADAYIGLANVYIAQEDYESAQEVIDEAKENVTDKDGIKMIEELQQKLYVILHPTPTPTFTSKPTPIPTSTVTPTQEATATPTPGDGAEDTPVLTPTPTLTPQLTPTPVNSAEQEEIPTISPSSTPTDSPTLTPTSTCTPTSTPTISPTPTEVPLESGEITELIIDLSGYEDYSTCRGGIIPVKSNGKWGAIDYTGKQIIPFEYELEQSATNTGYILFGNDNGRFIFDNTGALIAHSANKSEDYEDWDYITRIYDNYYIVEQYRESPAMIHEMYDVYYNYKGEPVVTTTRVYNISDSTTRNRYYASEMNGILTILDERISSTVEVPEQVKLEYAESHNCDVNQLEMCYGDAIEYYLGYLDAQGNVSWQKLYTYAFWGYAVIHTSDHKPDEHSLQNEDTDCVEEIIYEMHTDNYVVYDGVINGYFVADENDGTFSMRDKDGKLVDSKICSTYELSKYYLDSMYVRHFGDRVVAIVRDENNNISEYILFECTTGKNLAKFDYLSIMPNGMCYVKKDGKYGYCDLNGNVLMLFDDASNFSNGFAGVIINGTAAIINEKFEVVKYIGPATDVILTGEVICFKTENGYKYFLCNIEGK